MVSDVINQITMYSVHHKWQPWTSSLDVSFLWPVLVVSSLLVFYVHGQGWQATEFRLFRRNWVLPLHFTEEFLRRYYQVQYSWSDLPTSIPPVDNEDGEDGDHWWWSTWEAGWTSRAGSWTWPAALSPPAQTALQLPRSRHSSAAPCPSQSAGPPANPWEAAHRTPSPTLSRRAGCRRGCICCPPQIFAACPGRTSPASSSPSSPGAPGSRRRRSRRRTGLLPTRIPRTHGSLPGGHNHWSIQSTTITTNKRSFFKEVNSNHMLE